MDHGLQVMDITKAVLLQLRIIKLRSQYNLKMQEFERTKRTKYGFRDKYCFQYTAIAGIMESDIHQPMNRMLLSDEGRKWKFLLRGDQGNE